MYSLLHLECHFISISNLESQSHWSLFNGTWQKRPREQDDWLRFGNEEMTLQVQQAGVDVFMTSMVYTITYKHTYTHKHTHIMSTSSHNFIYVIYVPLLDYTRSHANTHVRTHKIRTSSHTFRDTDGLNIRYMYESYSTHTRVQTHTYTQIQYAPPPTLSGTRMIWCMWYVRYSYI